MIKALVNGPKGPMIMFGLSYQNLEELKKGKPIKIDLRDVGLGGGEVLIFSDETEEKMLQEFKQRGLIKDPCIICGKYICGHLANEGSNLVKNKI